MRKLELAMLLMLLSGCHSSPNINTVSAEAKTEVQRQLDQSYTDRHATVEKVSLIQTTAPKYEGQATIAAHHSTFDVPLKVTSDGKTTLVTVEDQPLQTGFQTALQHTLAPMTGKYSDYIVTPAILELMPASLQADKAKLMARLEVIVPIDSNDGYYFGPGCKAHECTMNEVAWTIGKTTGEGAAVIMEYVPERPGMSAYELFHLYGTTIDHLPQPLAAWSNERGMTEANVELDTPAYQPPPQR
jgi:hypothetical protein